MNVGVAGGYTPYNNFIQPARPQDIEDMAAPPLFVMKVGHRTDSPTVPVCFCSHYLL